MVTQYQPTQAEKPLVEEYERIAPVWIGPDQKSVRMPQDKIGVCLSGGGYRAMLFHLGSLWRLNEAGILHNAYNISSVSGGSITAAVLGMNWQALYADGSDGKDHFEDLIAKPILKLASVTIDVNSILFALTPFFGTGQRITKRYNKLLFKRKTLQDLPDETTGPRFTINATNLQSGVLWRFCKAYMADYTVGLVKDPKVPLAIAVAASAAFPPLLSPVNLKTESFTFAPDGDIIPSNSAHREKAVLTDGGVYENMGLESVWKKCRTVLVSDAGGGGGTWDGGAHKTWFHQFWRVFWIQRYQVGRLRRRQLIGSYRLSDESPYYRKGAYWSIGSNINNFELDDAMDAPFDKTVKLRDESTRLKAIPKQRQHRHVNWGYAVTDAALRKHCAELVDGPSPTFPFPEEGVG